ncbi:YceI family protein [Mucilaginibacter myungsuensis]|uniref:YceI family protein n=1 Tax=Mucilaginibacter myungsuensis TaxID=649104 RepID=A0A929PY64_9SPHI|nr:YceI family protein [Mucilaginibacter myungsuensis]MBE9663906.1 YceI family protein [Mucilaginibacter myungsuensis]MDN3598378.1 YceI family protein [Mucilaginibacter myungsuensis]
MKNSVKMAMLLLAAVICLAATQTLMAQTTYKLAPGQDVSIKLTGTSNIHDWAMLSTTMESTGDFGTKGNALTSLKNFTFQVAVKSLKSEHASLDKRMYADVKEAKYPTINYKLTSATIRPAAGGKFLIASKGDLTIAGSTQPISMDVLATVNDSGSITCTGTKKIQLTDYGIKPPSYVMGTMKVRNDLTIQFNLTYKK